MLQQIYNQPVSLPDIGINAERSAKIHSAVTELSPNIFLKNDRRKKHEAQVAELRASECASKAIAMVQERRKAALILQKEMTLSGHLTQIIDTFPENLELHSVDIKQAFTQADKLPEGVNGRYFINPPPGSPDAGNRT